MALGDDPIIPESPADVEKLLRAQAVVPPGPADASPWDFLLRADEEVRVRRIWPAVSRLLADDDPLMRLLSLEFVMAWNGGRDRTVERLLEIAQRRPDLFADQQVLGLRLRERLQHALANETTVKGRDVEALVALLVQLDDGKRPSPATATLFATRRPEHALALLPRLGDGATAESYRAGVLMGAAVFQRDRLPEFLRAMADRPPAEKAGLLKSIAGYLKMDDDKAAKLARSAGQQPPTRPAPTDAECRAALGLA